jgi:hypothetical protein
MALRGFIELSPELPRDKVHDIIEAAHRATADGRVILILSEHPVQDSLLEEARDADLVIADSERLSATLLSNGILHMRAQEGLFYLRSLAPAERDLEAATASAGGAGPKAGRTRHDRNTEA